MAITISFLPTVSVTYDDDDRPVSVEFDWGGAANDADANVTSLPTYRVDLLCERFDEWLLAQPQSGGSQGRTPTHAWFWELTP